MEASPEALRSWAGVGRLVTEEGQDRVAREEANTIEKIKNVDPRNTRERLQQCDG